MLRKKHNQGFLDFQPLPVGRLIIPDIGTFIIRTIFQLYRRITFCCESISFTLSYILRKRTNIFIFSISTFDLFILSWCIIMRNTGRASRGDNVVHCHLGNPNGVVLFYLPTPLSSCWGHFSLTISPCVDFS